MLNRIFDYAAMGYYVTHAYADGMVRMAKPIPKYGDREAVIWLSAAGIGFGPYFARKSEDGTVWMPDGNYMRTA